MPRLGLGLGVGAGSARFSPASLSPALWLDSSAASSLFQNSNGTTAASADTDPVGYWGDLSSNANHATQGTAANKPTLKTATINGKNSVQVDGNDTLAITDIPLTGAFAVYFVASRANNTTLCLFGASGGGLNAALLVGLGDNTVYVINDANSLIAGVYTGSNGTIIGRFRRTSANVCYLRATGMAEINIGTLSGTLTFNRVLARVQAAQYTDANNKFGTMLVFASDLPTANPTGDAALTTYLETWSGVSS